MLFLQLLAIAAVAIYLAPTGAHLFQLPNKLALSVDDYMVAQRLYDGWAAFGAVMLVARALVLAHAVAVRRSRAALALSAAAFLALAATQAVFWGWTYPVNVETDNWSRAPALFEAVRRQWEYSHAASAVLTFLSLMLLCASALVSRSPPPAG